jgi:membrane fusion protein (multidrug efflux system)
MSKGSVRFVCCIALLVAISFDRDVGGQTQKQSPPQASATKPVSLPVTTVISREFERTMRLPGDLVAYQDVSIHAKVEGFIERIDVDRGSAVRRGALLARVDAPELKARIDEAEAKVQTADAQRLEVEAALVSEQSTAERLKKASATPGVVAGNDVEVAQQKAEVARARVQAATRNVEAARQAVRSLRDIEAYLQVRAPFDGVVTERSAHVGSLVSPSSGPIVRMQQVSPLRLVAPIPEAYVASVRVGQPIQFTVAAFPGETFTGKLARTARALDVKTRTMAAELDVANGNGRLAPGMFAEVQWLARRSAPSLFVPRTAVATTTERSFVIRVRDGVAEWVDVRRGATMDNLLEVIGDLKPGDQVAVRATDEVRAGTRVTPVQQAGK